MYFFQIIVKTSEEQDLQNFLKGIDLRTSYLHKIKVKVEYALVFWQVFFCVYVCFIWQHFVWNSGSGGVKKFNCKKKTKQTSQLQI